MQKLKVLLHWEDSALRPEKILPFVRIARRYPITFIHLDRETNNNTKRHTDFPRVRFLDYLTPYRLLRSTTPDCVITGGGTDLPTTALIVACNNQNIPVFVMQHGIIADDFLNNLDLLLPNRKGNHLAKLTVHLRIVLFYLSSVLRNPVDSKHLMRLFIDYIYWDPYRAIQRNKFALRSPSHYIVFNRGSQKFFEGRDGDYRRRFHVIGIPYFDRTFQRITDGSIGRKRAERKFCLLIDTVLWGAESRIATPDQINAFHNGLNQFCIANGARLKIKLHPHYYGEDFFIEHENVDFIREIPEDDLLELSSHAWCVLSFFSTLFFTLLFTNRYFAIIKAKDLCPTDLVSLDGICVIDFFKPNFENLDRDNCIVTDQVIQYVEENYVHKADGCAEDRLAEALMHSSSKLH